MQISMCLLCVVVVVAVCMNEKFDDERGKENLLFSSPLFYRSLVAS